MENVVAIWVVNHDSEEGLKAYIEISYNEDEEAQPSGFMTSIGISRLDDDFMETHFIKDEEDRQVFSKYLRYEYCSNETFSEQLPPNLYESIDQYNSIILVYGNDSPYGSVNEFLFQTKGSIGRRSLRNGER